MPTRPNLEDSTVERINEKLDDVIRVDPEKVGFDQKLNVLLDELEEREGLEQFKQEMSREVSSINTEVQNLKMNMNNRR